jgi:hypothetical protein
MSSWFGDLLSNKHDYPPMTYMYASRLIKKSFKIPNGVIRIRKSKKDRQHNDQKKKDKRTNNDLQNIHIKLKIE